MGYLFTIGYLFTSCSHHWRAFHHCILDDRLRPRERPELLRAREEAEHFVSELRDLRNLWDFLWNNGETSMEKCHKNQGETNLQLFDTRRVAFWGLMIGQKRNSDLRSTSTWSEQNEMLASHGCSSTCGIRLPNEAGETDETSGCCMQNDELVVSKAALAVENRERLRRAAAWAKYCRGWCFVAVARGAHAL